MLIFSRKKNEVIRINDDITIVIVEIRGDKIRLGVECPKEMRVHRGENYEALLRTRPKEDTTINSTRMRRRVEALKDDIQRLKAEQQATQLRIDELQREVRKFGSELTLPTQPR
jgi:carbon storage regulator